VRVVEQLAHLDPLPERSCPPIAASVSYGTPAEHGLYFLTFSADCARHDVTLSRGDLLTPSEKLRAIADLIDRRAATAAPRTDS